VSDEKKTETRGSWRATVIWSLVLAVLAFGAVWAVTGWKTFHLAYCHRLIASKDEDRQIQGILKVAATHLRPGLAREEVARLFAPARLDGPVEGSPNNMHKSKTGDGFYLAHPVSADDGVALVFDPDGRLVKWWTVP
jgi:hypothetical protein